MKKIANIILSLLILVGCQEKYELNVDFQLPTHLDSPTAIQLDVTSAEPVVLSWTGGGAADGGIVLYEVLFDKEGGDFSNPLVSLKSDQGALPRLTLTHAALNTIARNAGILPQETGKLIWTVRASKGGVLKESDIQSAITVTRGEGIDNIPSQLFLYGSSTENNGQGGIPFRKVEDGLFQIYTTISAGEIQFRSATSGEAFTYYIDETAKLRKATVQPPWGHTAKW